MRLWSIHPKYLDSKGLVAHWRESLLAKKVLENKTKGYRKHPQLLRFKKNKNTQILINTYLYYIYLESLKRGYNFDSNKIGEKDTQLKIYVNDKQITYEFEHLLKKLKKRDMKKFEGIKNTSKIKTNPLFKIKEGNIEDWENYKGSGKESSTKLH
jgi:hypothetical protein